MLVLQKFYFKIYAVLRLHGLSRLWTMLWENTMWLCSAIFPSLPSWNSGNNPLNGMTSNSNVSERQESTVRGSLCFFHNVISSTLIFSIFGFHSIREKPASSIPLVSHHRLFCPFMKPIFCLTLSAAWKVTLIQKHTWSPLLTETRGYYLVQNSNSRLWDFYFF